MYQCLQAAGVTTEFELGPAPEVVKVYEAGEAFYVTQIAMTSDGRQRALTSEGWVSLVVSPRRNPLLPVSFLTFFLRDCL